MGKTKANPRANGSNAPKNLDTYLRLNYLLQASLLQHEQGHTELSRVYFSMIKNIAEKNVLRLTPEVKEQCCKYCNTVLVPGDRLCIKTKRKGKTVIEFKCGLCSTVSKRIPMKLKRRKRVTDTVVTSWSPAE